MSFTQEQRREWFRAHPEKRWRSAHKAKCNLRERQRYAQLRRKAEIEGAKQALLSAHRLRAIGIRAYYGPAAFELDSWELGR